MLDEHRRRFGKWRNRLHSWLLLSASVALLALTAYSLAGIQGLVWVGIGGAVTLWSASRITPELILRLYRARPLPPHAVEDGTHVVAELAARAGLPAPPRLYYVPSSNMNSFAVGRPDRAAIAVTDGLIRGLSLRQFAGVMAHEIGHIRNGDVRVMAIADMVSRMTSLMATFGLVMLVLYAPAVLAGSEAPWLAIGLLIAAPTLVGLLQLALSRTREYEADLDAAGLTGDPEGLASALATLERRQGALWERLMVPGGRVPDPSLLRTHPRTEDRIRRLLALRKTPERAPPVGAGASVPIVPLGLDPVRRPPRLHRTGVWF